MFLVVVFSCLTILAACMCACVCQCVCVLIVIICFCKEERKNGGKKKTSVFLFRLLVLIIRRDRHTPVYVKCWRLCLLPSQNIVVQRVQDVFCCPHRMSLREGKMLFVAPTGCRSETARCFLLPPRDVAQRGQDAFWCPHRMSSFKEYKMLFVCLLQDIFCCPHMMPLSLTRCF